MGCRHDPAFAAMVFWCDFGGFSVKSESDIRSWQLWAAGTIRPSLPSCFGVAAPASWKLETFIFEAASERIVCRVRK